MRYNRNIANQTKGHKMLLLNADSKDVFLDVIRSYHGQNIIIVSDPPFNIGYKYNSYADNMNEADYYEMLGFFFKDFPSVVIHYPEQLYKLAFQIGQFPEKIISWVYNSNTAKQHRDIAFFGVKPDMRKVPQPYKNPNDKRIKKLIESGRKGGRLYDWWNINQVKNVSKAKTAHPCQMPLQVMKNIVGVLPDDCVIVDPFMGSGTTGEAVVEMNAEQGVERQFVGIEIDETYHAIANNRIMNAGQKYS